MIGTHVTAPKGWTVSLLDKVTIRGSGHTPDKKKNAYWNGGIKWVSLADSDKLDAGFIGSTDKEVSEQGIRNSSAVVHPAGTVIISRDAGVGKAAVLQTDMAVSQHFIAWRCGEKLGLYNWFLYACLQLQKAEFERQAVGSTIKTIGLPYFKSLHIAHPSYGEQRRIAKVLDAWDDAIATAKNLVAAKEERLTWLADHLAFQAIEWLTIDDVAEQVSERAGSGFKSFDVFSCTKHDGLVLSDDYFTKTVYGADRTDYKVVHPLELAYATNHIEEGSIGLNAHGKPGIVSPMYTVFKATGINPHYLIAVLKTERMRREFERRTPASVNRRGGLRWGDFAEIEIPCPSEDEQARVLVMLDCARADFKAAEDYLALLRNQKRGLMQKLLTGQWRVPESIDALLPKAVAT